MSNLNVCSLICKKVDKQEQIIENVINEIDMPSNEKANIVIVTILNGIGIKPKKFKFDYFLNYFGTDEEEKAMYAPLFSIEMCTKEGDSSINRKSHHKDSFFEIFYDEVEANFPGKGNYELEVYNCDEDLSENAKERYRMYKEKNIEPISVYSFLVK